MNRRFALTGAGLLLAAVTLGLGKDRVDPVNKDGKALALKGYDPVAYFTEGEARVGSDAHVAVHDGAAYRFVSEANRKAFEKEPGRYLPQFGGFCAYGVTVGAKFDGDPRVFAVVDGKLYLNLNPDIQAKWEEDVKGNIGKAETGWQGIRDKDPGELK